MNFAPKLEHYPPPPMSLMCLCYFQVAQARHMTSPPIPRMLPSSPHRQSHQTWQPFPESLPPLPPPEVQARGELHSVKSLVLAVVWAYFSSSWGKGSSFTLWGLGELIAPKEANHKTPLLCAPIDGSSVYRQRERPRSKISKDRKNIYEKSFSEVVCYIRLFFQNNSAHYYTT